MTSDQTEDEGTAGLPFEASTLTEAQRVVLATRVCDVLDAVVRLCEVAPTAGPLADEIMALGPHMDRLLDAVALTKPARAPSDPPTSGLGNVRGFAAAPVDVRSRMGDEMTDTLPAHAASPGGTCWPRRPRCRTLANRLT